MSNVFTPKQLIKYAETRLFGSNVTPDMVHRIELHNGVLPSLLEQHIISEFGEAIKVVQKNGREPLFYSNGTLFIPQYSGFGRRRRYESMINAYIKASEREISFDGFKLINTEHGISFKSLDLDEDPRKTNHAYDNFAYDFVTGLFVPDEKYVNKKVFQLDFDEITTVIFGPTDAVAKQTDVVDRGNSTYLDAQIVRVGDERVLNIGYVYADQAGIMIDKMLREYEALARKGKKTLDIRIFMFGRVGGLEEGMRRHDLVYPTGIIDDVDLMNGRECVYPMHNVLAQVKGDRFNFNPTAVVNQTTEQLERARDLGCVCTEMETRETVESINKARRRYSGKIGVEFGFVGYVSDLPLRGDTLADELDSEKGEQESVRVILDNI